MRTQETLTFALVLTIFNCPLGACLPIDSLPWMPGVAAVSRAANTSERLGLSQHYLMDAAS
jgi:hypothetical protein